MYDIFQYRPRRRCQEQIFSTFVGGVDEILIWSQVVHAGAEYAEAAFDRDPEEHLGIVRLGSVQTLPVAMFLTGWECNVDALQR